MLVFDHPFSRTADLVIGSLTALRVPWLDLPRSIFGRPASDYPGPEGFKLESAAVWPLRGQDAWRTAAAAIVSMPLLDRILRAPSGPREVVSDGAATHPDERWFFINGICSDLRIAAINLSELSKFSGRPVQLLYNATEGFLIDVFECALGKAFDSTTEAAAANLLPLVAALADEKVKRVVLVSHSQGTIVAAVLLKILHEVLMPPAPTPPSGPKKVSQERKLARKLVADRRLVKDAKARASFDAAIAMLETKVSLADIAKLEMYCFANCATSMAPFATVSWPARKAPWIESYGNENDLVAKLGVLAPEHGAGSSRIEGERYRRLGAWGHMLNAHYLAPMYGALANAGLSPALSWSAFHENLRTRPRLWDYFGGKSPSNWP